MTEGQQVAVRKFHSQLEELFYDPHPHIFDFMLTLDHNQSNVSHKISINNAPTIKREMDLTDVN